MKILIAEDDNISRKMLFKVFNGYGFEVVTASDGYEAWSILEEPDHPRLLVLDWMMPGINGVEIVNRLRKRWDGHTYYIIILTILCKPEEIRFALDSGADEFISKPYFADTLRARANVGRRIVTLHETLSEKIRLLEEANATISYQASTDELTGLYNRRFFDESLNKSIFASRRHLFPVSLIMIDLDNFKIVNDKYGHSTGDRVLKKFADILRSVARTEDVFARWGGEEFISLLPHTTCVGATDLAERLRKTVESECVLVTSLLITASFGVVELKPDDDAESLIKRADKAMYRAKDEGRNRVIVG